MKPANTLFIFSDEHDPRLMGCSGHPLVNTPNLDRLASRGTRFSNAYTPSPICVPARASLATGRYVHKIGYWDNAIAYDGGVPGWGHSLQRAGMRVESIGKLHYRNEEDPTGFTRQQIPVHILDGIGQVWGAVRDPLPAVRGRSPLFDELGAGESSYNRYDLDVVRRAIEFLEERAQRPDAKPWILFLGLVAPHMPYVVPQRYLDLYPLDRVPLPKLMPREGYRRHPWVERLARHWDHDGALGSDERRRLTIASYMGLLTFLDENIGRLVDTLERTGLAEQTRVIYSSDHGDNLGARGMWNKCTLYRESTTVPLIMAGPDIPQDRVCTTNVNLVDLTPTFLASAGLEPIADDGGALATRSLFDVARQADDPTRPAFSEYHAVGSPTAAFMLTRGRFKYHHYIGYRPELFDLTVDPEETSDLALDPGYAGLIAECEGELRKILDPERVDRRAKDAQNAYVARFGGVEQVASIGTPGATPMPSSFTTTVQN